MNDIENHLEELKSINTNPKAYLVNYFDHIRNIIDIDTQAYLNDDYCCKAKERATKHLLEMIAAVNLFEKQCISNLNSNPVGQIKFEEFNQRVKCIDSKDAELEKELYCELFTIKKKLFMDKGIVYVGLGKYERLFGLSISQWDDDNGFVQPKHSEILFGILILIEDEFLLYGNKMKRWIE